MILLQIIISFHVVSQWLFYDESKMQLPFRNLDLDENDWDTETANIDDFSTNNLHEKISLDRGHASLIEFQTFMGKFGHVIPEAVILK